LPALNQLGQQPLQAKVTFQIARILRVVDNELEAFRKARISLCEKYGALNAETQSYDIRDEEKAQFDKEYDELRDTDIILNIPRLRLGMIETASLTGAAMMALDWLIVEN
jgi:hypothetical protein